MCIYTHICLHGRMYRYKYEIKIEMLLHYSLHNRKSWPSRMKDLMMSILYGQMIVHNSKYGLLLKFL